VSEQLNLSLPSPWSHIGVNPLSFIWEGIRN
jgi:hypothetical protein